MSKTVKKTRMQWAKVICAAHMTTVKAILALGQALKDAKDELEHGEFLAMIKSDLPFTASTAAPFHHRFFELLLLRQTLPVADLPAKFNFRRSTQLIFQPAQGQILQQCVSIGLRHLSPLRFERHALGARQRSRTSLRKHLGLYEQEHSAVSAATALEMYVRRWADGGVNVPRAEPAHLNKRANIRKIGTFVA